MDEPGAAELCAFQLNADYSRAAECQRLRAGFCVREAGAASATLVFTAGWVAATVPLAQPPLTMARCKSDCASVLPSCIVSTLLAASSTQFQRSAVAQARARASVASTAGPGPGNALLVVFAATGMATAVDAAPTVSEAALACCSLRAVSGAVCAISWRALRLAPLRCETITEARITTKHAMLSAALLPGPHAIQRLTLACIGRLPLTVAVRSAAVASGGVSEESLSVVTALLRQAYASMWQ
jgi:hypothetical protein